MTKQANPIDFKGICLNCDKILVVNTIVALKPPGRPYSTYLSNLVILKKYYLFPSQRFLVSRKNAMYIGLFLNSRKHLIAKF